MYREKSPYHDIRGGDYQDKSQSYRNINHNREV